MNLENVEYGIANHIARIEMKRPEVLNALSKGMFRDLKKAFGLATQDDDARVVEITGAGKAFSAGLDIREVGGFKSRTEAKQFVYGLVKPFWDQLCRCENCTRLRHSRRLDRINFCLLRRANRGAMLHVRSDRIFPYEWKKACRDELSRDPSYGR